MIKRSICYLSILLTLLPLQGLRAQSTPALTTQINAFIDDAYKPGEPGGVVLVARKGVVIFERAFGLANLEHNVPMQLNSVFCIASMTKQFTAVAVLQQVEKGTMALTDSVGKFLPDFPAPYKSITVEQLLTHTAGVPPARSVASLLAVGRGWLSADQVIATFKDQPLDFVPGTRSVYSNSGYQLLGYILEKVAKEPLPEFIEKTLLKPTGMDHSFWGNDMKIVPNRAAPYLFLRNGWENAVNGNVQIAWAAGALQSTARDFLTWNRALLAGTLIKKETLQKAWTAGRLADGTVTDYGYGWFIGELQGTPLVEHGGNMGGFMSHAIYLPREDVLVEVFLNSRGKRLPELIATDIAAAVLGKPLNMAAITLSADELQSYAGTYKDRTDVDVVIAVENGKLTYQKTGGPKWRMTPYAKDKVSFDNTSTIGEIQRDASGRIVAFAMQTLRGQYKNVIRRVN
ncbi:MAG TPA: serine hydrolase [Longimicrobiales bacterium]|nr:serine hydrolase [Longimicrobiales bacterium]